jgi:subtilisin family serine protease
VDTGTFTFAEDADAAVAALEFAEDQLLVQSLPGADESAVDAVFADAGSRVIDEIAEIDVKVLETAPGQLTRTAEKLADSGLFETFQKSYLYPPSIVPNDALYTRQTHLPQIRAEQAWDISTGDQGVIIAVVDTGVDPDHPDLKDKIIGGRNIYDSNDRFDDVMGHGTLVAGVAAASSNNGIGVTGIAWESPILAVRVGNAEGLSSSQHIAAGILWAVSNGAKVINVSFAPLWSDRVVKSAAQQAYQRGCLVVISAGNAGGLNTVTGFEEVMFIGAITPENQIASFSDRGPFVDLVAPGTAIRSTSFDGDYGMANGTSFSAPIVVGVTALAWSVNPGLRPVTIREAILSTAVDLGSAGEDDTFGRGAVDAAAAVQKAAQSFDPLDTTPPTVRVSTPVAGQSLSGRATATVTATDKYGVADVVLLVDGVAFATDTRSPYSFVIDTASFSSGSHELAFVGTDSSGNASAPKTVRVKFTAVSAAGSGAAGTIRFTSPAANTSVSGDVTIKASLSDADGLSVIEWFVDGESVFVSLLSGISSGVSFVWQSGGFTSGSHTITASVTDSKGNQTRGSLGLSRK